MKTIKILFVSLAALLITVACSNEDSYKAGFNQLAAGQSFYYANNIFDTLYVGSYGPWKITAGADAGWCSLDKMSGNGYTTYTIGVNISQNTTGELRKASFKIEDTQHPDEGHSDIVFLQVATRGDGSLGLAPNVSQITGTDGSVVSMTYDQQHRPLTLKIEKDNAILSQLSVSYNDNSGTMHVDYNTDELSGTYGSDYQSSKLTGEGRTVRQDESLYTYINTFGDGRYFFNIEDLSATNTGSIYHYQLLKWQNHPDSLHYADSLKYLRLSQGEVVELEKMKLTYSNTDNRYQSVDANQLLLGVERCNPFLLLSMFRDARSSRIISTASCPEADDITVTTELNSNRSIKTLTVRRAGAETVYTFSYTE